MAPASDLRGVRALITGANSGIGLETARGLALRGATIVAACRSPERAKPALEALRQDTQQDDIEFLQLDLASLDSVREAAALLHDEGKPIQLLINNAALAGHRGLTQDGFEIAFGVNHLGHFLLTALLFPLLDRTNGARCIHVASKAHYDYDRPTIDWDAQSRPTQTVTGMREYQLSKLANILFASELSRRAGDIGVLSVSLHPGVVASNIWRRIPWPVRPWMKRKMISNAAGAVTSLHCATAPAAELTRGAYYDTAALKEPSPLALDSALARELWARSEAFVGTTFDPKTAD